MELLRGLAGAIGLPPGLAPGLSGDPADESMPGSSADFLTDTHMTELLIGEPFDCTKFPREIWCRTCLACMEWKMCAQVRCHIIEKPSDAQRSWRMVFGFPDELITRVMGARRHELAITDRSGCPCEVQPPRADAERA